MTATMALAPLPTRQPVYALQAGDLIRCPATIPGATRIPKGTEVEVFDTYGNRPGTTTLRVITPSGVRCALVSNRVLVEVVDPDA